MWVLPCDIFNISFLEMTVAADHAALVCANTAIAVVVRESNTKGYFRGNTHSSKMGSCSHDVWIMFISKYIYIA